MKFQVKINLPTINWQFNKIRMMNAGSDFRYRERYLKAWVDSKPARGALDI